MERKSLFASKDRKVVLDSTERLKEFGYPDDAENPNTEIVLDQTYFGTYRRPQESTPSSGHFPRNSMYVPDTVASLRVNIRGLCEKRNLSLPNEFGKMKKSQLYAIYFSMIERQP